jgi:outer membrane scaffolding protein for murein synthesis (MipA/OmpV family)
MFVEYERLVGDAANAPLVVTYGKRDQIQLGIGATYSFNMKALW